MGRLPVVVIVALALGLLAVPAATAAPDPAAPEPAEMTTPSCAEGPEREGEVIVGTPCADHIVVPPAVTYVDGGPGDDLIEGSLTTATSTVAVAASRSCEVECHLEVGSQTFEGGPGDDIVYGDRGNDILRGDAGDDRLYGGIGDDRLEGGPGNDWLSGGFGSDTIDGQEGDDFVRGDGTIDHIFDTGGGYDTLSFATGVTPGFGAGKAPTVPGFPKGAEGERGVVVNLGLGGQDADDGVAASGGGVDEVQPGAFKRIVGSPFSDWIVGTGASEEIIGGGGADVVQGGGGADVLRGGADGDYLEGLPGSAMYGESGSEPSKDKVDFCTGGGAEVGCGSSTAAVVPRATGEVSVGEVAAGSGSVDIYLVGSTGADGVTVAYTETAVEFALSGTSFDTSEADASGCLVSATHAICPFAAPTAPNVPALDALLLAGMAGDDTIATVGFPPGASVVEIGGAGADTLSGGQSEDVLVDGPPGEASADALHAGSGDDALLHDGGADLLDGGEGSDLFLSVSICDGETIDGGSPLANDRDNASWAKNGALGVDARLDLGVVGEVGPDEAPVCASGSFDHLTGIEDLEGSTGSDVLYGDGRDNQLLGHQGEDTYRALGGNDTILANAGTRDRAIDCGDGEDTAVIDLAPIGDPAPIGCERVREGTPNEFETEIEQPVPAPVTVPTPSTTPPPSVKMPKRDRTPPRTRIVRRPAKLVRVAPRRAAPVTFRFAADERSRFECKLDARPCRRCRSPLRAHLRPGRHAFRVFAVDAAGNRDRTPARFRFHVAVLRHHGPHRTGR
jgi:Ca2+-binding RTX toxin-like protein